MRNTLNFPTFLLTAAVVTACSSMPNQNLLLDEARSDYRTAQNNPDVVQLASHELTEAGVALDKANVAFAERVNDETINKLAYLAKQKIATTQEIAKRKAAERTIENAASERNEVRLGLRTAEADQAKREALVAQGQVASAQAQAADAQYMAADAEARTRHLEAMLADMSAKKTERGMMITLNDVLFDVGHDRLKESGMRTIYKLAEFMKQYPQRTVLIEGYTDSTGNTMHNMELSKRRAESVATALKAMNISPDRISLQGYGEAYPVAANDTAGNRQLNRRVEVILSEDNDRVRLR